MPETKPNVTRSPRPPGLASAKTGVPVAGALVAQASGGGRTGVGLDDGQIAVDVVARHRPFGRAAVGEGDRHLAAADVVRVGQHAAFAQHDARADAPPLPDADHRGAGVFRQPRDAG